jgi:colicin import membrane protein
MTDPTIRRQREQEARERRERWAAEEARDRARQAEQARQQAAIEAEQARLQANRERLRADQERRQREDDRARLARLESQWANARQAAAVAAQQQRHAAFWAARSRGLDELIAMTAPAPPAVHPEQSAEPQQGSAYMGDADWDPAVMADPSRW